MFTPSVRGAPAWVLTTVFALVVLLGGSMSASVTFAIEDVPPPERSYNEPPSVERIDPWRSDERDRCREVWRCVSGGDGPSSTPTPDVPWGWSAD